MGILVKILIKKQFPNIWNTEQNMNQNEFDHFQINCVYR